MSTQDKLADALRVLIEHCTVSDDSCYGTLSTSFVRKIAEEALAEHDAPEECFCDRMYPDSNPNASCGDCPTQDYAQKPTPASAQADKQESEMSESRFYIEHGVVHDRKTGKHLVGCYYTDEDPDRLLSVLRELESALALQQESRNAD